MRKTAIITIIALSSLLISGCTQKNTDNTSTISENDAKKIALEHAGVNADQITFIHSNLEYDDGYQYYDVEFRGYKQEEYDYEIDPYTGKVLDFDYDAEHY